MLKDRKGPEWGPDWREGLWPRTERQGHAAQAGEKGTQTRLERGNSARNRKRVKDAKIGDAAQAGGGGREIPRKASYVMTFASIL